MKNAIEKIQWFGSEVVDGRAKPPILSSSAEKHLEGLNYGEIYICNADEDPTIFIRTNTDKIAAFSKKTNVDELRKLFINKDRIDETSFLVRFLDGIECGRFTSGPFGSGGCIRIDPETGQSYAEVDRLLVRIKAIFAELVIDRLSHVGGGSIWTPARMQCVKVEDMPDCYRCFFTSTDGGKTIDNEFAIGDQARSQEFNIKPGAHENVTNQYFWRLVVGVGGDYIDLSKIDCDSGSGVPLDGDEIVQLGNRTDKDRQNAIIISSYGPDAPSFKQYAGINSYSLAGKEVTSISPHGNRFIGDFLSKTGLNILTQLEVLEGLFRTEISSIRDELQKKDNYLTNSAFASNTAGWATTNDIKLFTVDGKFLYLNRNFYSEKKQVADVVRFEAKSVLRVKNSGVRQLNAELSRRPESGAAKFFMSFRHRVMRAGVLSVGFSGQGLWQEVRLEATDDFTDVEYSGLWDGTGDFELRFTGDAYFYSLAVTDNAFEDYITKFNTKFEQTDKVIDLLAQAVNEVDGKLESEIKITAEGIKLVNERTDRIGNTLTSMGIVIDGANETISQFVKKDNVISSINQTAESVSIDASKINLNGAVTFNSFNASLQSTINGKADSSSLGGLAYKSAVEMAQLGSTIIVGGYLNTEYIKVRRIDAYEGNIGLFSINNNGLYSGNAYNEAYIYPGTINLKRAYSYSGNVYARNECRLGDDANPESNEYSQGSMVGYFYRNFIATSDKTLYTPAVKIVSANNVGFNVGLEVIGALRVKGGVIEKGYNQSITSGGVNVLDLTFGTSYVILNTLKYSRFYIPTLSQVRRQCGFSEYEPFCIRVSFFGHRLSTEKTAISSQKHAGVSIEEAGILVDNNGNEWRNSSNDFARGDVMEFNLIWSWYGGYYAQLVNERY